MNLAEAIQSGVPFRKHRDTLYFHYEGKSLFKDKKSSYYIFNHLDFLDNTWELKSEEKLLSFEELESALEKHGGFKKLVELKKELGYKGE